MIERLFFQITYQIGFVRFNVLINRTITNISKTRDSVYIFVLTHSKKDYMGLQKLERRKWPMQT